MGRRHLFSSSHVFQGDNDQGWHHGERPYFQMARPGVPESNSFTCTSENTTVEGGQFIPQCNYCPLSTGYSPSGFNVENPFHQTHVSGPSHDPSIHAPAGGSFTMVPEYNGNHGSSSYYAEQNLHGVGGGSSELTVGNHRPSYKRKSPCTPAIFERGDTSRCFEAGSSSNHSTVSDLWLEKQNTESYRAQWEFSPSHRGNGLSIGSDANLRNVRSRPSLELESNFTRSHVSTNYSQPSFTNQTSNHPSSVGLVAENHNAPLGVWNHAFPSSSSRGRNIGSDFNFYGHEASHFNVLNANGGASFGMDGHLDDWHGPPSQYVRGIVNSYIQRPAPSFRASSPNLTMDDSSASDQVSQFTAESFAPHHVRPFCTSSFRTGDRNVRSRVSSDRFRRFSESFGDQLTPEGLVASDRTAIYGSRTLFDQHRHMRLDVDSMSYEELLALGERIGSVSTGLSDDLIKKCLTESVYSYSEQQPQEERCVICLEEYKNMDDFGRLNSCGHNFHSSCIRKWLSIKNSCPICKASALEDSLKNNN